MKRWLNNTILTSWEQRNAFTYGLLPLSLGFRAISAIRRYVYMHYFKPEILPVPVIVVGNISVGGTGKTPFVIALVTALKRQGFFPGVITRGYKGAVSKQGQVRSVDEHSQAVDVGDEALVLARNAKCPVAVGRNRVLAAKLLLTKYPEINLIVSDDGLQHYALHRDLEIAIVDGTRKFGNGFCLPAGPLREPPKRLRTVDFVVTNGGNEAAEWGMQTTLGDTLHRVNSPGTQTSIFNFVGQTVHAVAGLGAPQRFFDAIEAKGISIVKHPFPDHYAFQKHDFNFKQPHPILMTEKDAVKCQGMVSDNAWFVSVQVSLPEGLIEHIIRRLTDGQKTSRHTRLPDLQTTRSV
jgi:tetraacyldisaccharide 4'-kinase